MTLAAEPRHVARRTTREQTSGCARVGVCGGLCVPTERTATTSWISGQYTSMTRLLRLPRRDGGPLPGEGPTGASDTGVGPASSKCRRRFSA